MPVISKLILSIPEAQLLSHVGTELSFRLPMQEAAAFPHILAQLEARRVELGVQDYGISVTTLEDVFLKVAGHETLNDTAPDANSEAVVSVAAATSTDSHGRSSDDSGGSASEASSEHVNVDLEAATATVVPNGATTNTSTKRGQWLVWPLVIQCRAMSMCQKCLFSVYDVLCSFYDNWQHC